MTSVRLPSFHEAVFLVRPLARNPLRTALVGSVKPLGVELRLSLLFMDSCGTERWAFDVPHKNHSKGASDYWCWSHELDKAS